jgi:hypothetical protein
MLSHWQKFFQEEDNYDLGHAHLFRPGCRPCSENGRIGNVERFASQSEVGPACLTLTILLLRSALASLLAAWLGFNPNYVCRSMWLLIRRWVAVWQLPGEFGGSPIPSETFNPPSSQFSTHVGVSLNPPPQFITLDNRHVNNLVE